MIKCKVLMLLICLAILTGCTKNEAPTISKETIEDILKDVYTPKSMEEFKESKEKYTKYVITEEVANSLFVANSDKLTEEDLKRAIDIRVTYSNINNNSIKDDIYKADITLYYNNQSTNAEIVFFVNEKGIIYKYTTTVL